MTDLDKMARELLAAEYDRTATVGHAQMLRSTMPITTSVDKRAVNAIRSALLAAPPGYVLVPVELIDAFPEINPSNYGHDDACELNAWACELVTAAAPEVK